MNEYNFHPGWDWVYDWIRLPEPHDVYSDILVVEAVAADPTIQIVLHATNTTDRVSMQYVNHHSNNVVCQSNYVIFMIKFVS